MIVTTAAPAIVLGLASLVWIAVLARIFFLPGEWNVQWWLNTAPFIVAGLGMVGVLTGATTPLIEPSTSVGGLLAIASALVVSASLGLSGFTLGTHRRRLALWHQRDDHPEHLVTEGPYAVVRHPFYTSYIASMVGCVLAAPHVVTLAMLVVVAFRLNATAAREEERFLSSETLGARYAEYVSSTGRFLPSYGSLSPPPRWAGSSPPGSAPEAPGGDAACTRPAPWRARRSRRSGRWPAPDPGRCHRR